MDAFIQHCITTGEIPTDFALMTYTGLSPRTLDRYYSGSNDDDTDDTPGNTIDNVSDSNVNNKGKGSTGKSGKGKTNRNLKDENGRLNYKGYGAAIKKLVQYRQHYISTTALTNPKAIGHLNFLVKQGRWGAWVSEEKVNHGGELTVKLDSKSGDAFG
ncbi:hypothetical protein IZU99_02800 [Oscillospiraceae bacterium CM]|nr:hypothetical protein IZU99_02800 [Oscillospiraceae bacterium CM]